VPEVIARLDTLERKSVSERKGDPDAAG
jgi:hypothetical protein